MTDVVLDGFWEQCRGVIGRYPEPDERYVFEYDDVARREIHMLFVRRPLSVEWYDGDELVAEETLEPWTGFATHRADRVVEQRP